MEWHNILTNKIYLWICKKKKKSFFIIVWWKKYFSEIHNGIRLWLFIPSQSILLIFRIWNLWVYVCIQMCLFLVYSSCLCLQILTIMGGMKVKQHSKNKVNTINLQEGSPEHKLVIILIQEDMFLCSEFTF